MITNLDDVTEWTETERVSVNVRSAAWKAAEQWIANRCTWPAIDTDGNAVPAPDDLVLAVNVLTARLLDRRNSPNGLVGVGDLGATRIPGSDADVSSLIGPYRRVVI